MTTDDIKELYPFTPHHHRIRDYSIHYVDEGDGQPVLMLHGNPTWSFLYRNLIMALRGEFRVIAPDHLGCGLSDKPQNADYSLGNHIYHIESLVRALSLKQVTIVGHDWGGAVARGYARLHPENVKRIVMMNTAAFSMPAIPLRIRVCRTPVLGSLMVRWLNLFCLAATFMASVNPLPRMVKKGYLLPYDSPAHRIAVYRFIEDIPISPIHPSYETLLGIEHSLWMFSKTPVCLVWGMRDWCFTPEFLTKWMNYFPDANVLTLDNAGHLVLEDGKDEAIAFIRKFLKETH